MFNVIADSVMPPLIAAASRAGNLTVRSTFGHLVNEHAEVHEGENSKMLQAAESRMNTNFFFLIIPNAWAVISNLIVVITIFRTSTILRSFAYVMISLSLVDLCSSLFVIPFSIYFFSNHMHWGLGYPLCILWTAADVMFCTASICHHCAIALHRYLIISRPHDFSVTNNHKIIYRLIVPAWCVSAFIAMILVIRSTVDSDLIYDELGSSCGINDRTYAIYSSIVSFFIPLSIIVVVSLRSIFILQKRIDFKRRSQYGSSKRRMSLLAPSPLVDNVSLDYNTSLRSNTSQTTPISRSRRALSNIFERVHFRRSSGLPFLNDKKRKRKIGDQEVRVATKRIIFASKPRNLPLRNTINKRWSSNSNNQRPERSGSALYRAFESFTTKTLALTPTTDCPTPTDSPSAIGLTLNGLMLGFGPRSPLRISANSLTKGTGGENSITPNNSDLLLNLPNSRSHLSLRSSTSPKLQTASISPALQARRSQTMETRRETKHIVPNVNASIIDEDIISNKEPLVDDAKKPSTPVCDVTISNTGPLIDFDAYREEAMSHVTEDIIDELSLSRFNSTSRGKDFDTWAEMVPVPSARSSTSTDRMKRSVTGTLNKTNVRHENSIPVSVVSMSTTFPSDMMLSLPDIDRSGLSSERSSLLGGKISSRGPMSITEISTLNFRTAPSLNSITIEPPPLPPGTPQLTEPAPKVLPITQPVAVIMQKMRHSQTVVQRIESKRRRAPIAHMNSLEQFDCSTAKTSPPRKQLSIKKMRPDCSTLINGTPKPGKKIPPTKLSFVDSEYQESTSTPETLPKLISLTLSADPFLSTMEHHLEPVPDTPRKRRNSEIGNGGIPPPVGGPDVPEKFLEMIRQRDYERQVALIKRGRSVASIRAAARTGRSLTSQASQRLLNFRRAITNSLRSSRSMGDKDIAMQTLARRIKKEKQAGHALLVVLMCFVLMWAPFFTLNIAYGICGDCVSKVLFTLFSWTGWASCGVNPIIYTLCSRQFRQGLFRSLADAFRRLTRVDQHNVRGRSASAAIGRSLAPSRQI